MSRQPRPESYEADLIAMYPRPFVWGRVQAPTLLGLQRKAGDLETLNCRVYARVGGRRRRVTLERGKGGLVARVKP